MGREKNSTIHDELIVVAIKRAKKNPLGATGVA
jgi:hypothetical protein